MRILGGKYKGRNIVMPAGIRPTQNKVRKAIFDILGDMTGLSFLELFAGSGAVGFEAASRGAAEITLVEDKRSALKAIKNNVETFDITYCNLYSFDAERAIQLLNKEKRRFDIIFMDPPYYMGMSNPRTNCQNLGKSKRKIGAGAKKTLQMLGGCDILAPNGLLVVQHFKKDELPDRSGGLELGKRSMYGDTLLSVYRKSV